MRIEPFQTHHIGQFLKLAAAENWVAEAWEFEFLLSAFPVGCQAACGANGAPLGFVTALLHERSGWIGNLIVGPEARGKGIGESLFLKALTGLRAAGAETVWLTASSMGKELYEKHGFASIDAIVRWTGMGRGMEGAAPAAAEFDVAFDYLGWGDYRRRLLGVVAGRGETYAGTGMALVVQPAGGAAMIGPFAAVDPALAPHLFDRALAAVPRETKVLVDVPARNLPATEMLEARGFRPQGRNDLMYAGVKPHYRPEYVYGLASMGSCG